ncbi:MAG: hypothetical protein HYV09_31375 [Deltaproteobacteria bacterium]|nr:hypothetical protein [Deltaproteobacteria bacterium]
MHGLRLEHPLALRARGAFHVYVADGARVVVALATRARAAEAARAFDRVVEAHARVEDPHVPKIVARTEAALAFACPARRDLEGLLFEREGARLPFAAHLALVDTIAGVLVRARDAGVATGALSFGSVLLDDAGGVHLVTLGVNLSGARPDGSVRADAQVLAAPEVIAGAAPTASSDAYALVALSRALLPYVDLPPMVAEGLAGRTGKAAAYLGWESLAVLAAPPGARASLEEWRARTRALCADLDVVPDASALRATAARESILPAGPPGGFTIARDGSTFQAEGAPPVTVPPRSPLRRILAGLVTRWEQRAASCSVLDVGELGWPGEQPDPEAGANRVYVAIATLRRLGLRDLIVRTDEGYALDPRRSIQVR